MISLCVSIGNSNFKKAKFFFEKYPFLELRQDLLKYSYSELEELFKINKNIIFTLKNEFVSKEYIDLALNNNVKFIDIPVDEKSIYDVNSIPKSSTSIILSFHGNSEALRPKFNDLKGLNFQVLKIATNTYDHSIVETIEILERELDVDVIYIPMGEEYKEHRYSRLLDGQIFTYTFPTGEENTAPGQLSYEEAIDYLDCKNKFAVFGNPISHSKSPVLFNPYRSINSHYSRIRVDKFSELKKLIDELDLSGVNITSPFKLEAFLEWGIENEDLSKLRNINTLVRNKDTFISANTDVDGFEYATTDLVDTNSSYVIIGAGSTARTIIYSLKKLGFNNITICNRTFQKAIDLANDFECNAITFDEGIKRINEFDHSISTISSSLSQDVQMNVNYKDGDNLFAAEWLQGQAIKAFEIMGLEKKAVQVNPNRKGIKKNIVLIGFMGSGKSSFAKEISNELNIDHYDLDQLIESNLGNEIKDLISIDNKVVNDMNFRSLESNEFRKIKENRGIISLGGGFVENLNNLSLLKNSFVIYLHSRFDDLIKRIEGSERPLLKLSSVELKSLYEKRKNKYFSFSDLIVLSGEYSKTKEALIEEINNTRIFKR